MKQKIPINIILNGNVLERIKGLFQWEYDYTQLSEREKEAIDVKLIWLHDVVIPAIIKAKVNKTYDRRNKTMIYPRRNFMEGYNELQPLFHNIIVPLFKVQKYKDPKTKRPKKRRTLITNSDIAVYVSNGLLETELACDKLVMEMNNFHPDGKILFYGDIGKFLSSAGKLRMNFEILDYERWDHIQKILLASWFIPLGNTENNEFVKMMQLLRNRHIKLRTI